MRKLFVDKTIEIDAPRSRIWDALTKREHTDKWAAEFSSGGPRFHIESDWKLGSSVLWKGEDGKAIVEGTVTALEPNRLLRFTVFDLRSKERPPVNEEDGITYALSERNGKTTLHLLHGDFSAITDGETYQRLSAETWDRVLPKVKELAETTATGDQPTCGQGLAENSYLPAKVSELLASLAENLEVHMRALDLEDQNAKREFGVYKKLAQEYKEVAARLAATAREMASYRDLPMGSHDQEAMSDPKVFEAFSMFINIEQELLGLLQKRLEQNRKMLVKMSKAHAGR